MRYPPRSGPAGATVLIRSLFILALAAAFGPAFAAPMATDTYRHVIEQGVARGAYQSVAVGWIDGAQHETWFFGRAIKPDADSTFEIGAVTEVFTGLLLAQAAYEGKLRLQTPISELLPKGFPFTDPALGAITLQDLASHHSGLPALPPNLMPGAIDDPYADYSETDLLDFLANDHLQSAPGNFAYTPLDAGLLGYLLGHVYGASYANVLQTKILAPLGIRHTGFDDGGSLLPGYARGGPAAHWHFSALAGSAGLRSSLGDLLVFLQSNLRPESSPLRAALLLARQPHAFSSTQEYGLGWNIVEVGDAEQTWPLIWRASETAGFSTFIGFRTDQQQALVLLANSAQDLSALGMAWLQQRSPPPLPAAPAAPPSAEELAQYPGLYQVRDGAEIIVRLGKHGLNAQLRGQPAVPLFADAEDVFDAGVEGLAISFQREAGVVTSMVVNHSGTNFLAHRLSAHAPLIPRTPIALDRKSLSVYVGDYRLDGENLLRIGIHASALNLQMSGRAALPLLAFAPDHFADADGSCDLVFQRDAFGKVIALKLDLAGDERTALRAHWHAPVPLAK
jgi:CubicO group peptidase (beta-lactamase class C family)